MLININNIVVNISVFTSLIHFLKQLNEYHFKICLSSGSVWSQLYMETTVESVKVVEANNFLMYMMHDVVIQSARFLYRVFFFV